MKQDKIYILGGAMWLISDLLSDPAVMKQLRGSALDSVAKRLKELHPELKVVGPASLAASKIAKQTERYEKRLTQGIKEQIKKDASITDKDKELQEVIAQFAMSSEYLYEWLRVLFVVPADKQAVVNDAIEEIIKREGNVKTKLQIAIEWIASQESIDKQVLLNKLIYFQNS